MPNLHHLKDRVTLASMQYASLYVCLTSEADEPAKYRHTGDHQHLAQGGVAHQRRRLLAVHE